MKSPAVRELKPDEIANAVFLVQAKEIRQKRTGEPYLSLHLSDRTGEVEARMWDNVSEVMDTFDRDDFIKVRGLLQIYNTRPQFIVHKLRRVADAEVDFADFFPSSARDPEQMWTELRAIVTGIENTHLRDLLNAFLDDADIATRYKIAPAAEIDSPCLSLWPSGTCPFPVRAGETRCGSLWNGGLEPDGLLQGSSCTTSAKYTN